MVLRGLSVRGRLVREEMVVMVWGRWWVVDERDRGQCVDERDPWFLQREGLLRFFILKDQ